MRASSLAFVAERFDHPATVALLPFAESEVVQTGSFVFVVVAAVVAGRVQLSQEPFVLEWLERCARQPVFDEGGKVDVEVAAGVMPII